MSQEQKREPSCQNGELEVQLEALALFNEVVPEVGEAGIRGLLEHALQAQEEGLLGASIETDSGFFLVVDHDFLSIAKPDHSVRSLSLADVLILIGTTPTS